MTSMDTRLAALERDAGAGCACPIETVEVDHDQPLQHVPSACGRCRRPEIRQIAIERPVPDQEETR